MVQDERNGEQYREAAYGFLLEALDRCRRDLGRDGHVSGGELLTAIQDMAEDRFGPLSAMVFREWGIHGGGDFGNIVYELIERGILSRQQDDKLEHFMGGRPYDEVFEESYFQDDKS